MVLPCDLAPLKYQGPSNADKPHEQALCQVCQELGYNCRNAEEATAADLVDNEDDDVSVALTDTSEDSSVATQDNEDGITPVGSDDEAERNEEELYKKMKTLHITK